MQSVDLAIVECQSALSVKKAQAIQLKMERVKRTVCIFSLHDVKNINNILFLMMYTGETSAGTQDTNCAEYGFDSSGLQICRICESGYEILNGRCEKEGTTLYCYNVLEHIIIISNCYRLILRNPVCNLFIVFGSNQAILSKVLQESLQSRNLIIMVVL